MALEPAVAKGGGISTAHLRRLTAASLSAMIVPITFTTFFMDLPVPGGRMLRSGPRRR